MALTTVDRIELYLGADLTSDQAVEMGLIITAVQQMMESYTMRQFDAATHYYHDLGTGDREIVLNNIPISAVKWAAVGQDVLLTVRYTGSQVGAVEIEDEELRLHENLSTTEIDLTSSSITDVDSLVTAINALSNWTAVAASGYGGYPAVILSPITRCPMESGVTYEVDLCAPASWMRIYRQVEGLYLSDRVLPAGMPFLVIYTGGYDTIPTGLSQLATEMCAALWRYNLQFGGGILQSEKIGDYTYRLSDEVVQSGGILFGFKARLDQYARHSI